jgi:transcriptional regulator with XRE-family HTH domain
LGAFIADRRRILGLSQTALAERLNRASGAATFTRTEVSRYERGARHPVGDTVRWLAEALETTPAELYGAEAPADPAGELAELLGRGDLAAGDVSRLAYRWQAAEPPQLTAVRAGRTVGERLAAEVEARTEDLRLLDDHVGGRDLAPLVSRELALSVELLGEASYTEHTGRRLLSAVSDLAQLAGWVASDAGRAGEATRYYAVGMAAGHDAGDPALVASSLSSLAYQTANVGDRREAVLMASAADRGARTAVPVARTLFAERLAWARARIGDADGATRALDAADDRFTDAGTDPAPPWAYWLNRDEIDVMRGRVDVELHRASEAVALLSAAIGRYPADHVREVSLYRSYLAEAYAIAGERDEAARVAAELESAGSARADERAEHVRELLGA